jgi:hypothetical protein
MLGHGKDLHSTANSSLDHIFELVLGVHAKFSGMRVVREWHLGRLETQLGQLKLWVVLTLDRFQQGRTRPQATWICCVAIIKAGKPGGT